MSISADSAASIRPKWGDAKAVDRHFPNAIGKSKRYELLKEGTLRAKKFGRSTIWDLDSIASYIESLPDYGQAA
jgi:hypothetical protein